MPISMMRAGQAARVGEVFGPVELVHRLDEIGLRRGAQVEMIRPGNPCIIRLGGPKLCLRADDGSGVLVEWEEGVTDANAPG